MTEKHDESILGSSDDLRRSFMKKGALASGALALGASGTATAQDDDVLGNLDDEWKALIQATNFHPGGRFTFVSGVVEWAPNYGNVQDNWFSDYNTHLIRWLNTEEVAPLYVAHDAAIGEYDEERGYIPDTDDQNQPQLFEMNREWAPFGDDNRLLTVNASPVDEEVADQILDTEDWWQTTS